MRKSYIALAALAPLLLQAAPLSPEFAGRRSATLKVGRSAFYSAPAKVTIDEIFACPENTVLDGPYTEDAGYSGFQSSDQGRPGMSTAFYQAYHGCYKSINAVRVIGLFNYFDEESYNWLGCDERGGMQENYSLTQPVKFEIAFYRKDENGRPGELVHRQETDIVGRYLGVTYGSGDAECPMYEFKADLTEVVKLESGFMKFSAVDMGDSPSCWFSVFTADSSIDYAYIDMGSYGLQFANLPCIFSFMGDGSDAAQKALSVENVSAPSSNAHGSHEKVTVKIANTGATTISDATLELWIDGSHHTTETVSVDVAPGASFNYTFLSRVDLSAPGEHVVEVRNTTPGDEGISQNKAVAKTYTMAEGEVCESGYEYDDDRVNISRVVLGTIDNSSDLASYTDYTTDDACVTELRPGQTLSLEIETANPYVVGVWVDWNNDGLFDGVGEHLGYIIDEPLPVSIPDGISVSEGLKRLRLVMDVYGEPQPCGAYYFGETEDYGIMVKRNDNTPAVETDLNELADDTKGDDNGQASFVVTNNGENVLEAEVGVTYLLPEVYAPRVMAPARDFKSVVKALEFAKPAKSVKASEEASEPEIVHILRHDGGHDDAVSLGNYTSGIFAQYYPREQMEALKGMKLSSVDVYIHDVPAGTRIKVFGQGKDRSHSGEVLANQDFVPQPESWNHVVLDTPVEISGEDIWFGVEMTGMSSDLYHIGIDGIPAVAGYGDVCNVGGDTWWSMSELGIDHNFCVRGNVTGDRSPYLNWLNVDKTSITLGAGHNETVTATMNPAGLAKGTYEAAIEIRSNDELKPVHTLPVYFVNGVVASLDVCGVAKSDIKMTAEGIVVTSTDGIAGVKVADVAGHMVLSREEASTQVIIPVENLASGIYVLVVDYADGSRETMKFSLSK